MAAVEAAELKALRARTAERIKKNRQLQQVEAHVDRAMHVWVELDKPEKEVSLARIAATFIECLPPQYLDQIARALIFGSEAAGHTRPAALLVQAGGEPGPERLGQCHDACAEHVHEGCLEETAISLVAQSQLPECETSAFKMSEEQLDLHEDSSDCLPSEYLAQLARALILGEEGAGHTRPAALPVQTAGEPWPDVLGLCEAVYAAEQDHEGCLEETAISLEGQSQVPESEPSACEMSEGQVECHEELTAFPIPDRPTDCVQEQEEELIAGQSCAKPDIVDISDVEKEEAHVQNGTHAPNIQETCLPLVCQRISRPRYKQVRRTSHNPRLPSDIRSCRGFEAGPAAHGRPPKASGRKMVAQGPRPVAP